MLALTKSQMISENMAPAVISNQVAANELATAIQNKSGVTTLNKGEVIQGIKIPTSFSVTSRSNNAVGALTRTIKLFNPETFGAPVSDNGSGANSITYTFGDGASGNKYSKLLEIINGGQGLGIKGFTVKATRFEGGGPAPEFFTTANFKVLLDTLRNENIPFEVDLDEAFRNTQFQDNTLTVKCPMILNALMQVVYDQPANTVLSWTFFTQESNNL